ncbi:MAG: hypothetical protein RI907_3365 [Pseudomonadota bacterium]|jgi:molybdenum cofactor cytidylyltransferase
MSPAPTLIILATAQWHVQGASAAGDESRPAWPDFRALAQTLELGLDADWPVVVAAPRWVRQQCAVFAPSVTCIDADVLSPPTHASHWVQAIAQAVQASAQASSWVIMPGPMPNLRPETLATLQRQLTQQALVCPSHHMRLGYPLGLSGEFYSELVRLQSEHDLKRLLSRYPWATFETEDPAVLNVDSLRPMAAAETTRPPEAYTPGGRPS